MDATLRNVFVEVCSVMDLRYTIGDLDPFKDWQDDPETLEMRRFVCWVLVVYVGYKPRDLSKHMNIPEEDVRNDFRTFHQMVFNKNPWTMDEMLKDYEAMRADVERQACEEEKSTMQAQIQEDEKYHKDFETKAAADTAMSNAFAAKRIAEETKKGSALLAQRVMQIDKRIDNLKKSQKKEDTSFPMVALFLLGMLIIIGIIAIAFKQPSVIYVTPEPTQITYTTPELIAEPVTAPAVEPAIAKEPEKQPRSRVRVYRGGRLVE